MLQPILPVFPYQRELPKNSNTASWTDSNQFPIHSNDPWHFEKRKRYFIIEVSKVVTSTSTPIVSWRRIASGLCTKIILFRASFFWVLSKPLQFRERSFIEEPLLGLALLQVPQKFLSVFHLLDPLELFAMQKQSVKVFHDLFLWRED